MNRTIFVYGSLRRGAYNYSRFQQYFPNQIEYKNSYELSGFKLYSLGAYPGIKETAHHTDTIIIDQMEVSEECFNNINAMELGANYTGKSIKILGKEGIIYVYNGNVREDNLVQSGDWLKHLNVSVELPTVITT